MIVLTGGAGFIGSVVLSRLNAAGADNVVVVDELERSEKWKNLVGKSFEDYLTKDSFLQQIEEDTLPFKPRAIVHLGACTNTTETNADYMLDVNYRYTGTLAAWALAKKVRFIYASSAATYGDGSLGFDDDPELMPKLRALNVYGYSKQLFDLWALRTGAVGKICGLKFFNVYGPNEYHKGEMRSVVVKAFESVQRTGKIELFKSYRKDFPDGGQCRDFVYVKDIADCVVWLLQNSVCGIYNVGSGKARSWNDLATAVFSALERPAAIDYIEMPDSLKKQYQYFTEAKMARLQAQGFGGSPTSLEDGVRDYVRSYLTQPNRYL